MKTTALLAALGLAAAFAAPALAQDPAAACKPPAAPAMPDGSTATMEQMVAGKKAIDAFIAESDKYQECEIGGVAAQRAAAKASKAKFDENIAKAASDRINVNQKDKEAAGAGWSKALKAYKAAHPAG